ncbi:unnamed protein product [Calypogeia fissa]
MRIVSYNVNGLRARLSSPPRTLSAFLDSLDADIICLQETKMARHDLTADIAVAEGYESFFSCNRNAKKKSIGGYSGVATFCRVGILPSSTSPILPLAADEGLTGLLHRSQTGDNEGGKGRVGCYEEIAKTDLSMQELLQLDSEGRCLITDHGSFVLFNLYCPRVEGGDAERLKFKLDFFRTLQRRWEALLNRNRRVIAIGDFNISPYAIDHCDPGPDFDKNICRRWFRSLLKHEGGAFWDVFRFLHPDRQEAFTCWSAATGAEEFNYGTRIDLVLAAGCCNHEMSPQATSDETNHGFVECEVHGCDILTQFRRIKPDTHPRWQGGRSLKLEGSDHAPIVVHLKEQPPIESHEVPPLAARFMPEIRGRQQNLVALLKKQPSSLNSNGIRSNANGASASLFNVKRTSLSNTNNVVGKRKNQGTSASKLKKQGVHSVQKSPPHQKDLRAFFVSSSKAKISLADEDRSQSNVSLYSNISKRQSISFTDSGSEQHSTENIDAVPESRIEFNLTNENFKLTIQDADVLDSQESYPAGSGVINGSDEQCSDQREIGTDRRRSGELDIERLMQLEQIRAVEGTKQANASWSRIKEKMARAVPLCKGHDEPCVARVVKKPGPNIGRGFYVCARAEGPSSNPETRCDHFEWASSFKKGGGKPLAQRNDSEQPQTFLKRSS